MVHSGLKESKHKKRTSKSKRDLDFVISPKNVISQVNIEIESFGSRALRSSVPFEKRKEKEVHLKRNLYDNEAVSALHLMHEKQHET